MARGSREKQEAITRAARASFGRIGYVRSSIDAIAAEAGVSTRTIYKHFTGKEQLFAYVMRESATQVADRLTQLIDQHLGTAGDDLEAALLGLARDWIAAQVQFAGHFAMVRQIAAEAGRVPTSVLDSWHEAGPDRVEGALAAQMERLAAHNYMRAADPGRMAQHYLLLTVGDVAAPSPGSLHSTMSAAVPEVEETLRAGVQTFLWGFMPHRR